MTFLKNPVGEKSFGRIFFVYKIPKEKSPLSARSPAASQSESHGKCCKEIFSFGILQGMSVIPQLSN